MENLVKEQAIPSTPRSQSNIFDPSYYHGKKVLITGHTGFKGSWLSLILSSLGADVSGYALEPPAGPNLFHLANIAEVVDTRYGDVRDFDELASFVTECKPEAIFHLAAQPLVLAGYESPRYTFETNVMGTVNLLEAVRHAGGSETILNVTTDKVYMNREIEGYGYVETDHLDGYDPYSNSKSCSELVTHSYKRSFFDDAGIPVSTARAGNVIGGGDFAENRIIPDCVKALESGNPLEVRNPDSTRPFQHVLEPLFAYLMIAQRQAEQPLLASSYNVGPDDDDCVTTRELVDAFAKEWGSGFSWVDVSKGDAPHEASFLRLDSSKIKSTFGWSPRWGIIDAMKATVDWTRDYLCGHDLRSTMERQIDDFANGKAGTTK